MSNCVLKVNGISISNGTWVSEGSWISDNLYHSRSVFDLPISLIACYVHLCVLFLDVKLSFANASYSDNADNEKEHETTNGSGPMPDRPRNAMIYRNRNISENSYSEKTDESQDEMYDIVTPGESENDISKPSVPRSDTLNTLKPPVLTHRRGILYNSTSARRGIRRFSTVHRKLSAWSVIYEEEEGHRELILKIRKNLPLKDFSEEVRARKDVAQFLVQPVVLLDLTDTSLESIIEKLMGKLRKDLDLDEKLPIDSRKCFFTNFQRGNECLASVDQLRETIQGVKYVPDGTLYEQTWITALCILPNLKKSHVSIARLRHPLNLGNKFEEISFVVAIVAPRRQKFTKNAVEVGRTFATMMCNIQFRKELTDASTETEFKEVLKKQSESFVNEATQALADNSNEYEEEKMEEDFPFWHFGMGALQDLKRRLPLYLSDFRDGVVGKETKRKVTSTIFFLYFACILPAIAFGTVYSENTKNYMSVISCIISQTFGGLMFALFGGQPLLVVMTTAPVALFVKVVYLVAESLDADFLSFYAMVGIWNSLFLILQGFLHASKLMKYSTRSTEEVFEFFVALAFCADVVKSAMGNHDKNYNFVTMNATNSTVNEELPENCYTEDYCTRPENFLLFLFLMFGTFALALMILHFKQSQFLSAIKREILADFALPISVIAFSIVGSVAFQDIHLTPFEYSPSQLKLELAPFHKLRIDTILVAAGLGLSLSCLFYVEQNVASVLVNNPANKLQKGPAYHWDLIVIALINGVLSIFNLPWVHGALPHSPLHVRALADVEQHVSALGAVQDDVVRVRETRLTGIVSNILIGLSILIINVLQLIPVPVLQGLFLYLAFNSFIGNQMFDRMLLFLTDESSYPPNHYVRKVPQNKLHLLTLCQIIQLAAVALFGLAPWFQMKVVFPVLILLLWPIRHKILTLFIEPKYLHILDSH